MMYFTGDTHIDIDIKKLGSKEWPTGSSLTKNDYVVVLGDFGLIWNLQESALEMWWTKWLNDKPWTTLWLDGNHENFNRIKELPVIEKFGAKVGKVTNSIFHLRRGEIYKIEDKTFFCFGGASSVDKHLRTELISWWPEEEPSYSEIDNAAKNLEQVNYTVDYVLTHTAPQVIIDKLNSPLPGFQCKTAKFLNMVYEKAKFKKWFCGHLHIDHQIDNIIMMYENIIKLND